MTERGDESLEHRLTGIEESVSTLKTDVDRLILLDKVNAANDLNIQKSLLTAIEELRAAYAKDRLLLFGRDEFDENALIFRFRAIEGIYKTLRWLNGGFWTAIVGAGAALLLNYFAKKVGP